MKSKMKKKCRQKMSNRQFVSVSLKRILQNALAVNQTKSKLSEKRERDKKVHENRFVCSVSLNKMNSIEKKMRNERRNANFGSEQQFAFDSNSFHVENTTYTHFK